MLNIINTILGLGAAVIMPIVILILGLVFRMNVKKAIRAGLTVGIGFIGINLAIGLISNNLGGIVEGLQNKFNLTLNITDVGWPAGSAIAFGNGTFVVACIITFLVINAIFLILNWTHTLNVDIFNYWHHILIGTMSYFATGNMVIGIIIATAFMMINTILAERQEDVVVDFGGEQWRGLSFTTQSFPIQLLFSRACNWVIDRIPVINKINFNLNQLPSSISFFAEPAILGFILGGVLSAVAGYTWENILSVGINMAAAMYLLPRMVSIMMEGLAPLTDAARDFMTSKFPGRKFNLAMDYCMLMGDKEVITMGLIGIPIVLFLAVILPGNKFLPFTDLPSLPYWVIGIVYGSRHNAFRTIIISIISFALALYMVTDLAPLFTQMASNVGFEFATGTTIGGYCIGFEWVGYILHKIVTFIF